MPILLRAVLIAGTLLSAAARACPNPDVIGDDPPGHVLTVPQRAGVFDAFVKLVRERAVDPTFGGRNSAARVNVARAAALSAPDDRGFYQRMRAFANSLGDDHLEFLSPADVRSEAADSSPDASYGGIGVTGRGDDRGYLVIETVRQGGPAAAAGVREGDALTSVDGACPTVDKVRGPAGTSVRLRVLQGGVERDLALKRARVGTSEGIVASRLKDDPGVGYLRFDSFEVDGIAGQVQGALYLLTQGDPLRGLIIDLRANGGGQLYEMRRFLGIFLEGDVGETRDRDETALPVVVRSSYGQAVDRLRGVPLAVLVGAHTASAAEYAAAILQRFGRARVLGANTARLTTVASVFELPSGSEAYVPTADFYLGGVRLGEKGVVPDVRLPSSAPVAPDDDPAVRRARRELTGR